MRTLNVRLTSHFELNIAEMNGINPEMLKHLKNALSVANPDVYRKRSMGFYVGKETPTKIGMFEITTDSPAKILVDRGKWEVLDTVAKKFGVKLQPSDHRHDEKWLAYPEFSGVLEEYQRTVISDVLGSSCQGLIDVATAGGKTVMAIALLAALKRKFVVLVHTKELMDQWIERFNQFLPGADVGRYGGGKEKFGEHGTVCMLQTLSRKPIPMALASTTSVVIADEVHHCAAPTFQRVIGQFPAKFRYGLTATVKRRDGKTFLLYATFGAVLAKLEYKDIADRVIMPSVEFVAAPTSLNYRQAYRRWRDRVTGEPQEALDHVKFDELLSKDPVRNEFLLQKLRSLASPGSYVLCIVKRIEHAKHLSTVLASEGISAESVYGEGMPKKEREEVLRRARAKKTQVLIGTSLADEGLDIGHLNKLLLAVPTFFEGRLAQRMGRIIRIAMGKSSAEVIDVVDKQVIETVNAYLRRLRFYKRLGLEIRSEVEV